MTAPRGWLPLLGFWGCWLAACAGVPTALAPSPTAPAGDAVAIVGATVVPMDRERLLAGHTVLVQGGRIVALGPDGQVPLPAGTRVIAAGGRFLLPGLADMHTHLLREADLWLYVARGVTTVRNMWGAPLHLGWRQRIARGELLGPTLVTAGPIVDGERPVHPGSLVVRSPQEAESAVALHRRAGYDLIKVYSGLSAPAYEQLLQAARRVGLPVAGHVPRAVGLPRAIASGLGSIEHLTGFVDALQAEGSPVAGKRDRASRLRHIDHIDEGKVAALVQSLRQAGTVNCPTRTVMDAWDAAAAVQRHLARAEMRYVPAATRSTWTPPPDRPDEVASDRKTAALFDRLIGALHRGGARLVVGTDPVNPLVVPGFSVHDELAHLVRAGLSPYQALRAATVEPAALLGQPAELGTVAVGRRADLLLVEGNPLEDIRRTGAIAGVMVRGRWLDRPELTGLLEKAAAGIDGEASAFAGMTGLSPAPGSRVVFSARYRVTWRGVYFGSERLLVERRADGQQVVQAQAFNPHQGQRLSARLEVGPTQRGQRLVVNSHGAQGEGRLEVLRDLQNASLTGQVLAGLPLALERPLGSHFFLGPDGFLAARIILGPQLQALAVGQSVELNEATASVTTEGRLQQQTARYTRLPDAAAPGTGGRTTVARRYQLAPAKGPRGELLLDEAGWPLELRLQVHGAVVLFQRSSGP